MEPLILIVDDDEDDVFFLKRALEEEGVRCRCRSVADGASAARLLVDGDGEPQRISLVVMDIKLPKVGGLDLLRQIRAHDRTRDLPVIMLSSSAEERDRSAAFELGARAFLRKPSNTAAYSQIAKTISANLT